MLYGTEECLAFIKLQSTISLLNGESIDADISLLNSVLVESLALGLVSLLGGSCLALGGEGVALLVLAGSLLGGTSLLSGIRIKLLESIDVLERVGLGSVLLRSSLGDVENRLDFIGVDDTSQISVSHGGGRDVLSVLSVNSVKGIEGGLRPDAETSHMTTRGQLQKIQTVDTAKFDSRQVAESLFHTIVGLVNNEGTTTHGVTAVSHLTLTGADLLGGSSLVNIIKGSNGSKDILGNRGLLGGLDGVVEDKGNLGDLIDLVSTSHDESRHGGCGKGRGNGVSLLGDVALVVPLAPGLGGSEHASSTAHVSESSLSGTGGSSSTDTRDTGNSTSSSPRGGTSCLSGHDRDGVGLTLVLVHVGVNKLNNVGTKGSLEDSGESGLSLLLSGSAENANKGASGSHG